MSSCAIIQLLLIYLFLSFLYLFSPRPTAGHSGGRQQCNQECMARVGKRWLGCNDPSLPWVRPCRSPRRTSQVWTPPPLRLLLIYKIISRKMRPKQQEMDGIVERIHKKLIQDDTQKRKGLNAGESLPTLFLLCSDHGMNEMGNHGGSSLSETSSIFIFMSSLFEPPLSSLNSEAKGE